MFCCDSFKRGYVIRNADGAEIDVKELRSMSKSMCWDRCSTRANLGSILFQVPIMTTHFRRRYTIRCFVSVQILLLVTMTKTLYQTMGKTKRKSRNLIDENLNLFLSNFNKGVSGVLTSRILHLNISGWKSSAYKQRTKYALFNVQQCILYTNNTRITYIFTICKKLLNKNCLSICTFLL